MAQQETVPLAAEHVPEFASGKAAVLLASIFHHRGVNALAEDQILNFGPKLTLDPIAGNTVPWRSLRGVANRVGSLSFSHLLK